MKPDFIKLPVRKFLFASDLHLNHGDVPTFITTLEPWDYDALIISGDIGNAASTTRYLRAIYEDIGVPVLFVLGNHDYYGSSITQVRQDIDSKFSALPVMHLNGRQIIELSPSAAMVGVDGWGDGRAGYGQKSTMKLNDSFYIRELYHAANRDNQHLFATMRKLADVDTAMLSRTLTMALKRYETVYVLTHVPPLTVTCLYQGEPSSPHALPLFCNLGLGRELQRLAKLHPQRRIKVLCGHTHDRCHWRQNNLEIWVAGAIYGFPAAEQVFNVR